MPTGIILENDGTIQGASAPVLTFDDTNGFLEIAECNVGIGTATPISKLDVEGEVNIGDTADKIRIRDSGSNAIIDSEVNTLIIRTSGAMPITFETNGANERMRIQSDGTISIGSAQEMRNIWFDAGTGSQVSDLFIKDQDAFFIVELTVGHHGGGITSNYGYKRYAVWTTSYLTGSAQITELDSILDTNAAISLAVSGANIRATIDNGPFNTQGMIKVTTFNGAILSF